MYKEVPNGKLTWKHAANEGHFSSPPKLCWFYGSRMLLGAFIIYWCDHVENWDLCIFNALHILLFCRVPQSRYLDELLNLGFDTSFLISWFSEMFTSALPWLFGRVRNTIFGNLALCHPSFSSLINKLLWVICGASLLLLWVKHFGRIVEILWFKQ